MSRHEQEIQEIIQHFNVRLGQLATTGGDLTSFETKLLHRLNMYTALLSQGGNKRSSFSTISTTAKGRPKN